MVIGILQFELLIRDSQSLKDKRRVVSSLKERLQREYHASVAEVARQDNHSVARLALALVGSDGKHIAQMLDRITTGLHAMHDAELSGIARELLHEPQGEPLPEPTDPRDALAHDQSLVEEMRRLAEQALEKPGERS